MHTESGLCIRLVASTEDTEEEDVILIHEGQNIIERPDIHA
jgi:hypothetical protein